MDKLPDSVIKPGRERKTAKRATRRPPTKKTFCHRPSSEMMRVMPA